MRGTNQYLTRAASGEDSSLNIASAGTGKTRPALFLLIHQSDQYQIGTLPRTHLDGYNHMDANLNTRALLAYTARPQSKESDLK